MKLWVLNNDEKLFSWAKRHSTQTVQMAFRSPGTQKCFQKRITQQGIVEEDLLWSGGKSYYHIKLQFVSGRQNAAYYVKMLNNSSIPQEGRRLYGGDCIFRHYIVAIYNAPIIKQYLLEQKIRPQSYWKFVRVDCCKNLSRRTTVLSYSWTQKRNLRRRWKITSFQL